MISPIALLTAMAVAQDRGAVTTGLPSQPGLEDDRLGDGLALDYLAGRIARGPERRRSFDPSSFLMDEDLRVRSAEGESVLRLPWFDEELFVGRSLAEIHEMPAHVRDLCVEHYTAALAGERGRFAFVSYGHGYTVEAVPLRGGDGRFLAVLGIANPATRPRTGLKRRQLTSREIQILQLAARGMSGPAIAEHLVVSCATIKTHFQNIYAKWHVSDRASAVAEAMRQGLID
jgi:DNA-binding CsgD family transcriptional regulator